MEDKLLILLKYLHIDQMADKLKEGRIEKVVVTKDDSYIFYLSFKQMLPFHEYQLLLNNTDNFPYPSSFYLHYSDNNYDQEQLMLYLGYLLEKLKNDYPAFATLTTENFKIDNKIRIGAGNEIQLEQLKQLNSEIIQMLDQLGITMGLEYFIDLDNDEFKSIQDQMENPQLHVTWSEHLQEIHVQVMGEIQLEILEQLLQERFSLAISFEQGNILYKETITKPIEAVGHFEPLRHYAEVHLLLEPGSENSGIIFENKCDLEVLTKNWQHQIMTALKSKEHLGVLTGSPITDMKITLIGGKGSLVHSVGGDFREATYRAIRQGLMELKVRNELQLLEPWYDFHLEVEQDEVGRALNDIQRMHGKFDTPENNGNRTIINGSAPVSEMRDYATEVRSYTHGQGIFECVVKGYLPCHNADEIIAAKDYDPVSDLENTPNSVFCSHGAGHTVTWDQVPQTAHYPYSYPLD